MLTNKLRCLLWPRIEQRSPVSLNETETHLQLQPHAPTLPPQTLTSGAESQVIPPVSQLTWFCRHSPWSLHIKKTSAIPSSELNNSTTNCICHPRIFTPSGSERVNIHHDTAIWQSKEIMFAIKISCSRSGPVLRFQLKIKTIKVNLSQWAFYCRCYQFLELT